MSLIGNMDTNRRGVESLAAPIWYSKLESLVQSLVGMRGEEDVIANPVTGIWPE